MLERLTPERRELAAEFVPYAWKCLRTLQAEDRRWLSEDAESAWMLALCHLASTWDPARCDEFKKYLSFNLQRRALDHWRDETHHRSKHRHRGAEVVLDPDGYELRNGQTLFTQSDGTEPYREVDVALSIAEIPDPRTREIAVSVLVRDEKRQDVASRWGVTPSRITQLVRAAAVTITPRAA